MQQMPEPIWLSDHFVAIISAREVALFGGQSGGVRDENLLKAALGRPLDKWHYDDAKPSLYSLAAATCCALLKSHVFYDGNMRTAYIAAIVFLELNGIICAPGQEDIVRTILGIVDSSVSEYDLADWFAANSTVAAN